MADIKVQIEEVQKQAQAVLADVQAKAEKVAGVAQQAASDVVALGNKAAGELGGTATKQLEALKAEGSAQDKLNAQKDLVAAYPAQLKVVAEGAVELAGKVAGELKAAVAA